MSEYILGIDAGGTKTHGCLVDTSGRILATATSTGANWERVGWDGAQTVLREVVSTLLTDAAVDRKEISAATFALAGIDWPADADLFFDFSDSLKFKMPGLFINDGLASLYAGKPDGLGIVSIAGTGGKTVGNDGVRSVQTMGMSIGEGAGAGQVIALTLNALGRQYHRGEGTSPLAKIVLSFSKEQNLADFFHSYARNGLLLSESIAPIVFQLASAGDSDAIEIVSAVASQHAVDVINIIEKLDFKVNVIDVIKSGGLHIAENQIFDETFNAGLAPIAQRVSVKTLKISPAFGAVVYAAISHFGGSNQEFYETLQEQIGTRVGL
ncbi:MAG: BadF/BadG/BcrA/BcrD ATPase family protein [Actinomycetes bacterium]